MVFTQSDVDSIRSAIMALVAGARVVSLTVAGQSIEYQPLDLDKLRALLAEAQAEVQSAAGRRRFVLTSASKGL